MARRRLGYTITEWLDLPWWHRRVYLEGLEAEAEAREDAAAAQGGGGGRPGTQPAPTGLDALYGGSLADVQASTAFSVRR